jgi:SNF2 family DNA or RNA helicase
MASAFPIVEQKSPEMMMGSSVSDSFVQMFGQAQQDMAQAADIHKKFAAKNKSRKKQFANVVVPQPFADVEPTEPTPFGFNLTAGKRLFPHQIYFVSWMIQTVFVNLLGIYGVLLNADMGLGKTLSSLCFLQWRKFNWQAGRLWFPALICCPLNLASQARLLLCCLVCVYICLCTVGRSIKRVLWQFAETTYCA